MAFDAVIPEYRMCSIWLDPHQESVGDVFVETLATSEKSDTILVNKPIDNCCESCKMFADITDDPFLRGQMEKEQT